MFSRRSHRSHRGYSRQELYDLAFRNVYPDRGTRYSCSQHDIDRARNFHSSHTGEYVSANTADREIVEWNRPDRTPGRSEAAAIRRLQDAIARCDGQRWGPDIITKAFLDLDQIFFCGRLRDIVKIVWKGNFRANKAGWDTYDRGNPRSGRREIWLNAHLLFRQVRQPWEQMWSTILHEMCHAYEKTQVRYRERDDDAHSPHFGTKLRAVNRRMYRLTGLLAMLPGEEYRAYQY